jgi:peptidoglycan/LPS O-acetylase OafA/YrhL
VFFSISGYLITASWLRSPQVRRFLAARVLRIFPALVVVVLITIFVIGPLITTSRAYFSSAQTWGYLQNVTLLAVYELPGVFEDLPRPVVNGSLWSLGPEFVCYLCVLVLGLAVARYPRARAVLLTLLFIGVYVVAPEPLRFIAGSMAFFGVGSIIASLRIPLPLWPALPALVVWVVVGSLLPSLAVPVAWLVVPYAVVALGTRSTPVLRRFGRFGDVSYGTYLWGYPVQQTVNVVFGILPLWLDLLVVVPLTLGIAWISWHVVEKRALALKPASKRADDGNRTPRARSGRAFRKSWIA